jgi:hypothetical protein
MCSNPDHHYYAVLYSTRPHRIIICIISYHNLVLRPRPADNDSRAMHVTRRGTHECIVQATPNNTIIYNNDATTNHIDVNVNVVNMTSTPRKAKQRKAKRCRVTLHQSTAILSSVCPSLALALVSCLVSQHTVHTVLGVRGLLTKVV